MSFFKILIFLVLMLIPAISFSDSHDQKKEVLEKSFLSIYKVYQSKLLDLNACDFGDLILHCLLYTSPSPRDPKTSRMPSSA